MSQGSGPGGGTGGPGSGPGGAGTPEEFDEAAFEAAFAAEFGQTVEPERTVREGDSPRAGEPAGDGDAGTEGDARSTPSAGTPAAAPAPAPSAERRRVLAVVLTPIASAPVLAALCAMAEVDADIVPSKRGALAAKVIITSGELDPSELLTGAPAEATELATVLSRTAKVGVVLLTARLADGEDGITGTISGREYQGGEPGEEVAPGLILAHADDVVEQILLGTLDPAQAPGRLVPKEMSRWQAARLMAKQVRRRRP